MALKQAEQARLESLNQTVGILAGMSLEASVIKEKTKDMVQSLEQDTNSKLELVTFDGQMQYKLIDLRSDFIRTRYNTDKSMLSLRAKVFGLPVDVKVMKENDDLRASNAQVAESLRELASVVEGMPVEMVEQGKADWSRVAGEFPKALGDDSIDDEPGSQSGGDDLPPAGNTQNVGNEPQGAANPENGTETTAQQTEPSSVTTQQMQQTQQTEDPSTQQAPNQSANSELTGAPVEQQVGESLT